VKAYVAITDNDWFRFLKYRSPLDEVNFWQPGGNRIFKALDPGEPLLFKLHHPQNAIAGVGLFTHFSLLPVSLAWEAFEEKNGAVSFDEMQRLIRRHRRSVPDPHQDFKIGCIILRDPFFFEQHDWIQVPKDFHSNIVQGKTYDLRSSVGRELWQEVLDVLQRRQAVPVENKHVAEGLVYGEPRLVRQRLGQGTFRVLVTDTYLRRCVVTGERALPTLEAAHIRPVTKGGAHRVDNGLLLRSDVHALFDRGYVSVTPDYCFRVSRRLKDDFDNGEHYYQFEGKALWLPRRADDRPNREFLEWHSDVVFRP